MQGFGVLLFVFGATAFGGAFLGVSGGMSEGDVKLALLGVALLVSGAVFVAVGSLADGLRHAGELMSRQASGGAPAPGGAAPQGEPQPRRNETAGPIRRPGFHRAGAQREAA
jgi:hypothetical protein